MKNEKYKTNIKCSACVAKVTPYLNEAVGTEAWQVDINDPSKVLTVTNETSEGKIKEALEKAGYKAEKI